LKVFRVNLILKIWGRFNSSGCANLAIHVSFHFIVSLFPFFFVMAALSLTLLAGISRAQAQAQQAQPDSYAAFEGRTASKVEIAVRPGQNVDELRPLIRQEVGKPLSMDEVRASVTALQQTGKFPIVQVSLTLDPQGVRVLFLLPPVYNVGLVSFPGATTAVSYTQLLQAVNIPLDSVFVQDELPDKQQALQDFLAQQGFFSASVSATFQPDEAHRIVNIAFECVMHSRAKVGEITVQGVSPAEAADVQRTLGSFWARVNRTSLRPGTTYSRYRIDKSVDRLTAYFRKRGHLAPNIHFNPHYDAETNRAALALTVEPGPVVFVRIEGTHLWKRTMQKLIPVYQENSVDQDLVDEGQRNLVSYFQSKSYFDVTVTARLDTQPNQVSVIYRVDKGKKHRVSSVKFEGNHFFDEKQLDSYIAVSRAKLLFNRGKFSKDLLEKSADSLSALYKNQGFAKVVVTPFVNDHEPNIDIVFHIDEGERSTVNNLATVKPNGEPLQIKTGNHPLQLGPGKPYSPHLLEEDRNQILAWYLNHGYPNARFDSKVSPVNGDKTLVDVVYQVDEGSEVKVGNVLLLGNEHTRSSFIYSLTQPNVKPGDPEGQRKLLTSEGDLYNLGVFDWASVAPVGPTSDQGDQQVLIRVHESRRNSMDIGGGLEIIPRNGNIPVGAVVVPGIPAVSLGNKFTVSQKSFVGPRGTFQFARHNLRGRAETATIGIIASRLDQRLSFTYADPDLHGSTWSSLFSLSGERTTQNPIYTALLQQGSFQVEKQLDRRRTRKLVGGYSYQRTDLSKIIIPELVLPQDQRVKLSTFYVQYIGDTRDKPLDAHHGIYQTFNFGVSPTTLGSSSSLVRFLGQTAFYRPVKPWLTWANNFRLGLAAGFGDHSYVPLSERFFSGGPDSLRGFPIYGAGPQRPVPVCSNPSDASTCTLISVPNGGLMLAIVNSEARFPIPIMNNLGGVFFYDGGNVYSHINLHQFVNNYSNSIGFGFRYNTKVGPIRLDIGRNLNPIPGVKATQYFVTLGQAF
jgi:outer membrane protein insertion porin family